jgi:DNA-binding NarL/FixJ family response regulator
MRMKFKRPDGSEVSKFVYLDMEEYRDLELTAAAFMRTLDRRGMEQVRAGIALQAYVPDTFRVLQRIQEWARKRVAAGGSAVDTEVISQILGRSRNRAEIDRLTPREREVLTLMAEGLSNAGIADRLVISAGAVEKHISNVFMKLGLEPGEGAHRRVLAVLTYLRGA